jgi:predicted DNA-binding transcriptional regulator AlpA
MEKLMTIAELSDVLQAPKSWIYSKTRETGPDALPKIKMGKYLRFRPRDVESWIDARAT